MEIIAYISIDPWGTFLLCYVQYQCGGKNLPSSAEESRNKLACNTPRIRKTRRMALMKEVNL